MVNLGIATNHKEVVFGPPKNILALGRQTYCIEQVSAEMYTALLEMGGMEEHNPTVSQLLYSVVTKKGLSNN